VPLSRQRRKKRGYNQAELLAREIGKQMGIPVYSHLVKRIKNTKPQKNLNPSERQNNLKKAFIIGQNDVKLSTIVIIDDIYTTGSTIDAVAQALTGTVAEKVYFAVLSAGEGY
jgi:ComF family protein